MVVAISKKRCKVGVGSVILVSEQVRADHVNLSL